jgi:hypothetical protein
MTGEPSIPVPTAPIMNRGPELFVKASSLSASCLVNEPLFLISVVILAPTGYPDVTPRARAKEAQPGTLNKGLISGSSRLPAALVKPEEFIISLATKKGNSEGTTTEAHRLRPFSADFTAVLEYMIRHMMKIRHINGIDKYLIYISIVGWNVSIIIRNTEARRINATIINPSQLFTLLRNVFPKQKNITWIHWGHMFLKKRDGLLGYSIILCHTKPSHKYFFLCLHSSLTSIGRR